MKTLIVAVIAVVVLGTGLAVALIANPFQAKPEDAPVVKAPEKAPPEPAPKSVPPAKPVVPPVKPPAELPAPTSKTPLEREPVIAQLVREQPGPGEQPEAKPEPLPDVPLADPKSKLTPLNKEKTLYIEKLPNGDSRVLFTAEVCLREGMLEVFLCKKNTKEHEAILRTDIDARFLHAALVASGAAVGKPVQFLNPKTSEEEYKPASGQKVRVVLHYSLNGKTRTHPAQEWILDKRTKKPMTHDWVFAGSRFLKNPDRPNDPDYYTANNGEVISLSNFVDSMLELPLAVSREAAELNYDALQAKIPPLKSQVWVIFEPIPEKKK